MTLADDLTAAMEPYLVYDDGVALPTLIQAVYRMAQQIDDLVRDSDAGPGWSALLDPGRSPEWALGWLSQFPGQGNTPDLSTPEAVLAARRQIVNAPSWQRGNPDAAAAEIKPLLSGTQRVVITERLAGNAWHHDIATYGVETPADTSEILAIIKRHTPYGNTITYTLRQHRVYDDLAALSTDYNDMKADYGTYDNMSVVLM